MKLLVQEFLEQHSFKELQEQHGVYASFSKSGHKFSLNYDQIEAKEIDPLAQECRGLILSLMDGQPIMGLTDANGKVSRDHLVLGPTKVLAYPMKRFFNHGQGSAADIDWSDTKLAILEKLDGTLCIVYWDPWSEAWCVATRSVPEADLPLDNGIFTFRTLFEKALKETTELFFSEFADYLSKNITYCFELTTPYNRIVVNYPKCVITLLAERQLNTFNEIDPNKDVLSLTVPVVQAHTYNTIDELVNWVSSLNPMEHEGVVVRDGNFNRIKVKNAAYVAYNKVRDRLGTSERNIVELILQEKDDDVIPMLPEEIVKNLQKIKVGIQETIRHHDEMYASIIPLVMSLEGNAAKKDFAIMAQRIAKEEQGKLWLSPLFQMFDGKAANMKDFIMKNRKDGSWGDSFLDHLLDLAKKSAV